MIRRPPRSTRTDTLFPYTTLWKTISTRSVVSNGPGRIIQAFSVRSSTWPKSQLRADWAINDALAGLVGSPLTTIATVEQAMEARAEGLTSYEPASSEERRAGNACVSKYG